MGWSDKEKSSLFQFPSAHSSEGHFSTTSSITADGLAELGVLFVFHLSMCNSSWRGGWLHREEVDSLQRNSQIFSS